MAERQATGPVSRRRSVVRVALVCVAGAMVATLAIVLIVIGLPDHSAQASAPVPAHDFQVVDPDDPVTGAPPPLAGTVGGPGAGDDGTVLPDGHSRRAGGNQVPDGPIEDNRLVVPVLGIDVVVTDNPLDADNSLVLPDDVNRIAEWDGSAPISSDRGTVLIAGHVDDARQGIGALYWLHTLQPGDAVYLARHGAVTRWKVTAMQSFRKADLPKEIWAGPDGPRTLALVTCGGELVRDANGNGTYVDNVVVSAVPF